MSHNLWMMGMDLNSPHPESNMHPRPQLPPGVNPKKKRRTNAKAAPRSQQTAECPPVVQLQNLRPPPLSCFGDIVSVANPFDDIMPRSSQSTMQPWNVQQMHPNAMQHMGGPGFRAMNPMTSMGGMRAMMPNNVGAINQMGNHMKAVGGISPISNSPVGRMSPINNMGSNQPPGAMNQMGNNMNPMGGMSPISNSPVGRMSPMSNMGSNQPPGAMNQMGNHMNPMGGMSPMRNSPVGRMSPMNNMGSNQPPGAMHQMGNPVGRVSPMNHMGLNQPSGAANQPPGAMNPMANQMNPMGGMAPMSNMGAHMNQSHMGHMSSNRMSGGAMGNSSSPMNGMPGNNQNHMANVGTINGPSFDNVNGPFGQNGTQPHHMGMNVHMNMGRQINGPMATMAPSNINITGRNSNIMSSMPHHNRMGGPISSLFSGRPPSGHASMNMTSNNGPHGFQSRPGMRLMTPSTGKIYPPDQPMVFNSQNRNAPPTYLCGACHKEVNDNDQGIVCESGCNFWFHRMCVGLTEAAFQLLTKEVYAEWVCDKCLNMKKVPPVKFRT